MTENKGDLISREALKKAIEEVEDNYDGYEPNDLGKFISKVDELINNAPTVEPICNQIAWEQGYESGLAQCKSERPKGEWLSLTPPDIRTDTNDYFKMCDKCNHAARFISADLPYKFCPNCGAKMQNGGATDEP